MIHLDTARPEVFRFEFVDVAAAGDVTELNGGRGDELTAVLAEKDFEDVGSQHGALVD